LTAHYRKSNEQLWQNFVPDRKTVTTLGSEVKWWGVFSCDVACPRTAGCYKWLHWQHIRRWRTPTCPAKGHLVFFFAELFL